MSKFQLLLPKMGESVAEATIIKWLKKPGDYIEADEAVMEIATDKVDSEVPSPVSGKLVEQLCKEDDVVQVGAVIAIIETGEAEEISTAPQPEAAPVIQKQEEIITPSQPEYQPEPTADIPGMDKLSSRPAGQYNESEFKSSSRFYSPLVKHIATQEGISVAELDQIPGSGMDGRLTKDDLLDYVKAKSPRQTTQRSAPPVPPKEPVSVFSNVQRPVADIPKPAPSPVFTEAQRPVTDVPKPAPAEEKQPVADIPKAAPAASMSGGDEIIEMDRMRRLIADHMVMSKQTSPHVTSFVEADVTGLVMWREKIKGAFEKRENEKITFTPIFIEAVVKAIKDFPMINVSVNGTQIIKKAAVNISMATALPSGNLIVPVIKNADGLNLLGLTKAVNDLAKRARIGKLQPDDVKDGTFTITNVGSFGNVMGTPIINQPQVAILAVGAIKKKPAVIETPEGDVIAIRHMMFLSLSYDHRVVDGALGGSFVRKVADYLENWDAGRNV
jgi:2-oxoglutarate dehydrogenase E2 component (dihydrolipoamide succinyltransferase)